MGCFIMERDYGKKIDSLKEQMESLQSIRTAASVR